MRKNIFMLMGILSIISLISASPVEISIFPQKASACPSNTAVYELSLKNIGPVKDTYELTSSSPEEITIAPNKITIESGQEYKDPFIWYTPKTSTEPGTYTFKIFATSLTTGERYSIEAMIEVLPCHDIDITQISEEKICLGEKGSVEISIENNGRNTEKIKLRSDEGKLNMNELELEPGTSQNVFLEVDGNELGKKDILLEAISLTSFAKDSKLIEVNVENCYDSRIKVSPQSQEICIDKEGEFNVIIENTGTKQDTFTLRASGGRLEENEVTLDSGERKEVKLFFKPTSKKTYKLSVVAEGKSTSMDTFEVNGISCRNVAIITTPSELKICENEVGNFDVTVKNTGEVEDTFILASNIGSLAENKLNLDAGDKEIVDLEVDARKLEEGKHLVKIKAKSTIDENVKDTSEVELNVLNCYDLNMNLMSTSERIDSGGKVLIENMLKNTGSKENTYKLSLIGPEWISMRPEEVTLKPGESKKVFIHAAAPFNINGTFNVVVKAKDKSNTVNKIESFTLKVGKEKIEVSLPEKRKTPLEFLSEIWNSINKYLSRIEAPVGLIISVIIGLIIVALILWRETRI